MSQAFTIFSPVCPHFGRQSSWLSRPCPGSREGWTPSPPHWRSWSWSPGPGWPGLPSSGTAQWSSCAQCRVTSWAGWRGCCHSGWTSWEGNHLPPPPPLGNCSTSNKIYTSVQVLNPVNNIFYGWNVGWILAYWPCIWLRCWLWSLVWVFPRLSGGS